MPLVPKAYRSGITSQKSSRPVKARRAKRMVLYSLAGLLAIISGASAAILRQPDGTSLIFLQSGGDKTVAGGQTITSQPDTAPESANGASATRQQPATPSPNRPPSSPSASNSGNGPAACTSSCSTDPSLPAATTLTILPEKITVTSGQTSSRQLTLSLTNGATISAPQLARTTATADFELDYGPAPTTNKQSSWEVTLTIGADVAPGSYDLTLTSDGHSAVLPIAIE